MNGDLNVNLDQQAIQECLKTINNIGSTTYQNVCSGGIAVVPWGTADWILMLFLGGILLSVFLMILSVVIGIFEL